MAKNLTSLCKLLRATDIKYTTISENEISIGSMTLKVAEGTAEFCKTALNPLEETLWEDDSYLHIVENEDGFFDLVTLHE